MNIFLINSHSNGVKFGIGSYINMLTRVLTGLDVSFYLVDIIYGLSGSVEITKEDKTTKIKITIHSDNRNANSVEETLISDLDSRAIFAVLSDFVMKSFQNIFHLNSIVEMNLGNVISEIDSCKVVYTIHVFLMDVLFKADRERFKRDWDQQHATPEIFSLKMEKQLCTLADKIVCLTNEMREFAIEYYLIPRSKIVLIHNCVDTSIKPLNVLKKNKLKKTYGLTSPVILYSGRLLFEKGLDHLLRALAGIFNLGHSFHIIICGDGDLAFYLSLCRPFIFRTTFTGFINKKELFEFYKIADVGVLLSRMDQNSFSAIEMMSFGIPVIVADTGAFLHLKHKKETVVPIPITNKSENEILDNLQCEIIKLLTDPMRRSRIGKNARNLIASRYSLADQAEQVWTLYNGLF